jgi:hypothetical protein
VRTTVTLDPDVQTLLRAAMRERGISFKEALNSAVRAGLTRPRTGKRRFVQRTFAMGTARSFDWDKALAAATSVEDEELTRKFSLRG